MCTFTQVRPLSSDPDLGLVIHMGRLRLRGRHQGSRAAPEPGASPSAGSQPERKPTKTPRSGWPGADVGGQVV